MFHPISPWQGVWPYASGSRTRVGSIFLYSLALGFRKWPVAAATVTFFKTSNKRHHKEKTCLAPQLQQLSPPLKNVIFTVGVKSISKMSFLRSMGSTKKHASYRAWEAHFRVLQHLRSETATFFLAFRPQRGAKN